MRSSKRTLEPSKTKYPLGKHPNNLMPYKIIPRYGIGAIKAAAPGHHRRWSQQNPYKNRVSLVELGRTSPRFIVDFEKIPTKKFLRYGRCAFVFGLSVCLSRISCTPSALSPKNPKPVRWFYYGCMSCISPFVRRALRAFPRTIDVVGAGIVCDGAICYTPTVFFILEYYAVIAHIGSARHV